MELLRKIHLKAQKLNKKIILPESFEERTLQATDIILREKLAQIVLIGNPEKLKDRISELGLQNMESVEFVDPDNCNKLSEYAEIMVEMRKHKGMTTEKAMELLKVVGFL